MISYLFITLAVALLVGWPIWAAVAASAFIFLWMTDFPTMGVIIARMTAGVNSFPLLALPFFIVAGDLMAFGTTPRLMRIANAFFGHLRGGMAVSGVAACAFFGSISGSGVATTAAVGSIIEPEMLKKGYSAGFTASLFAGSGTLGIIIPPSLTMVVYGVAGNVSIGDLFMAGILPGLLAAATLMGYSVWAAVHYKYSDNQPRASWREKLSAMKDGVLPLCMPLIIMGGVMSGIFTPTEAGVVAAVFGFVLAVFVYKDLKLCDVPAVLIKSAKSSAMILIIIAAASPFGWVMAVNQVPQAIFETLTSITTIPLILISLVIFLLLVLGTFMETIAVIIIITPIVLPIIHQIGMNATHFGVVMMLALAIGGATPPLAVNLFMSTKIINIKVEECFPYILQVVGVMMIPLILTAAIPWLSLWIPSLVHG